MSNKAIEGYTKHKLGFTVDAEELLGKLQNSEHMEGRGYNILYSGDFSDKGYDVYKLCLRKDDDAYLYLHLRFKFGKINKIYYLITLGDEDIILTDLRKALQEARK